MYTQLLHLQTEYMHLQEKVTSEIAEHNQLQFKFAKLYTVLIKKILPSLSPSQRMEILNVVQD